MEKTKIKLIKEVYQYDGELYEDLDSCLSDAMSDRLLRLISAYIYKINSLNDFIRFLTNDKRFKQQVDEVLNVDNYEVTE